VKRAPRTENRAPLRADDLRVPRAAVDRVARVDAKAVRFRARAGDRPQPRRPDRPRTTTCRHGRKVHERERQIVRAGDDALEPIRAGRIGPSSTTSARHRAPRRPRGRRRRPAARIRSRRARHPRRPSARAPARRRRRAARGTRRRHELGSSDVEIYGRNTPGGFQTINARCGGRGSPIRTADSRSTRRSFPIRRSRATGRRRPPR
jgi:hypothetical protein